MAADSFMIKVCLTIAGLSLTNATSVAEALTAVRWQYGNLANALRIRFIKLCDGFPITKFYTQTMTTNKAI